MKEIEIILNGTTTKLKVHDERLNDEHQNDYMNIALKMNVENQNELKEAYKELPKFRDRMIKVVTDLTEDEIKVMPLVEKEKIADLVYSVLNPLSRFTKG